MNPVEAIFCINTFKLWFLFRNKENKILFAPPPKRRRGTNGRDMAQSTCVCLYNVPAARDLEFFESMPSIPQLWKNNELMLSIR